MLTLALTGTRVIQAQTPVGAIEGTVVDSSGGTVAGAAVVATNVDTNQARGTVTDSTGGFRITQLPVGPYDIQASHPGFVNAKQVGLLVPIGATVRLTMVLVPTGVTETVGVTASSTQPLDIRQTATATIVDNERIEELPVRSRDYLHFAQLAPGLTSSQSAASSSTTAGLLDSGFSFAGLRPRSNMLTIDGLDNNDRYSGTSRTELSLETVREFRVVSNGWQPENGGASGGAINVVTKSGTNILHGDAFIFYESGHLDSSPAFEETLGTKPDLTRIRAGFALGGPVRTDRTFYYAAIERERSDGQAASGIDPAVVAAINAQLASRPVATLTSGLFPTSLTETEWSAKVNDQPNDRHSVMVRVAGTNRENQGDAFNTGGLTDVSARGSANTSDTNLTANWTSVIGSRATNDLRGQIADRKLDLSTGDQNGPGVVIGGVAEFGRPYAGNSSHEQRYLEIGDTLAWSSQAHFVKAGIDLMHVGLTGSRTDGMGGVYQYRSLDDFLAGHPDSIRQVVGDSAADLSSTHIGTFVQDHWTPLSQFTLDFGLRFDTEQLPARLNVTDHQWSPRLGAAWTPGGKWLVRGGVGTFADRLVLAAFEPALLVDGQHGFERILSSGSTGAVPPSIYTVQAGSWQPSSRQAGIGLERQLTDNLTASVNYLFAQGRQQPRTVNVNLPPPTVLTLANAPSLGVEAPVPQQIGRPVFGPSRLDPTWDAIFQLQPSASSTYHGVSLMLNRRLAHELEWSAAYTWSRASDDASDFDEQPQNPYDLANESGPTRYDERQRFVASALFDLPIGDEEDRAPGQTPGFWTRVFSNIELAPILTLDSGRPVNPLTGADDAQTLAFPTTARPLSMARNSLRLPASMTVDLRVLKSFTIQPHGKLDLVVEAFNLLNRVNVTELNAVYGPLATPAASFGQPIDASQARRVQFSLDFEF